MDPDVCLAEIRQCIFEINELTRDCDIAAVGETLAERVEALDKWLTQGGFVPADWSIR